MIRRAAQPAKELGELPGALGGELSFVLGGLADAVTMQAADGSLVYANDAAAELLGFASAEALLAAPVGEILARFELMDESGSPLATSGLPSRRALAGEHVRDEVVRFRVLETGEERWSVVSAKPVLDGAGSVDLVINVFREITKEKRAEARLRFLAEASEMLSGSLDYEATLQDVARLAVPQLADGCVVDILDEGQEIRQVAIAHVDSEKERLIRELESRYPTDPDDLRSPAGRALRSAVPEAIRDLDARLPEMARDRAHLEALERLAPTSAMIVPLVARGHTLGSMTFLRTTPGRRYDAGDLSLAEDLAHRAALAIDNARLFRGAEESLALLDTILETAPVGFAFFDRELRYVRINEALAEINGIAAPEHLGRTLSEMLPQLGEELTAVLGRVIASGEPELDREVVGETPARPGEIRSWLVSFYPVLTPEAQVLGVGAVVVETTERKRAELAVQASEARKSAILESALDCVVSMDHEGRIVEFNPAAEGTFGYRAADALGRRLVDLLVPPSLREGHSLGLARYLETGKTSVIGRRVELTAMRADGTTFPVELAVTRVDLPGPPLFTGYIRDITERRRGEERLRFLADASATLSESLEYEQTLAALARLAAGFLADWCVVDVVDDEGELRRLAIAHVDPTKLELADALQRRFPTSRDAERGPAQVIRTGRPELIAEISDEMLVAAARSPEHLSVLRGLGFSSYICVPLLSRGEVLGAITLVAAESGRRYGAEDLALAELLARRAALAVDNARLYHEAEERAHAARVLATIGDGVFLLDSGSAIRLWNPAAEAITGLRAADVVGRRAADAIPGWDAVAPLVPVAGAPGPGSPSPETIPIELGGRELWLSIAGVGFSEGTVYAFRDVTEVRGVEELKNEFVATVSHELRTPLAAVYGAAKTLRRHGFDGDDETRDRLLDVIADESDRLARIVNDILWASRLDSGRVEFEIESHDARELVRAVVDAARLHLPAGVSLELDVPGSPPPVAADAVKLQQVLANLVENAVKYSPDGGLVSVRLRANGDVLEIAVYDEGLGIPAAEHERIFEKFYRLDPHMTRGVGGTGLGLYISRELARRMAGRITLTSQEGRGSTFVLELPLARAGD